MFGTIYSLYALSMLWTLLGAQQNASNLCGLSGQNMAGLTNAFSIGNILYVGNGTVFYPMVKDLQYSSEAWFDVIFDGECFNRLINDH